MIAMYKGRGRSMRRRARSMRVTMTCPVCESPLTVVIVPGYEATRSEPGDGPEITDIVGCDHADMLYSDSDFYEASCALAAWEAEGRRDAAIDAEIEWRRENE